MEEAPVTTSSSLVLKTSRLCAFAHHLLPGQHRCAFRLSSKMMESSVPFDTSSPAVRDYLALVRLQVLTPLSLLVNIVVLVVCAAVLDPSIEGISDDYRTVLTAKPWMVQMYVIAIWVGQVGYCGLLVLVRKPETKQTLIHGSGQWLVWVNWVFAGWAVAFVCHRRLLHSPLAHIIFTTRSCKASSSRRFFSELHLYSSPSLTSYVLAFMYVGSSHSRLIGPRDCAPAHDSPAPRHGTHPRTPSPLLHPPIHASVRASSLVRSCSAALPTC
jgi:hypothetical protein